MMDSKTGMCEVSVTTNLNIKGYEYYKVTVGFSEPYDTSLEGNRENKYYELLEATQHRLLEMCEETKKTIEVIKK
jgi:hypothetical protein